MKSNNMFRDQMALVTEWFGHWNECEKTVALYWLLKRVSNTQCKFIAQVLDQMDCSELDSVVEEANDPSKYSIEPIYLSNAWEWRKKR